jgi:hypothetical protein
MGDVVNINDVLDDHVALEVECVDRLYLNAYVPNLQVGPQVNHFLARHLGYRIGSPLSSRASAPASDARSRRSPGVIGCRSCS